MAARTLGNEIRAARLGFHWCEPFGCYLRIDGADRPPYRVELAPAGKLPNGGGRTCRRWWDGDHGEMAEAAHLPAQRPRRQQADIHPRGRKRGVPGHTRPLRPHRCL